MMWKYFYDVPDNIRRNYFSNDGIVVIRQNWTLLNKAAAVYWDRNIPVLMESHEDRVRRRLAGSRGIRSSHGIWYPLPVEVAECCKRLKMPGYNAPVWQLLQHCRTVRHVALLYGVDPKELQKCINGDLRIKPRSAGKHCRDCGKFAKRDSDFCTFHGRLDHAWQEVNKIADQYEQTQLNLLNSIE